MKKSRFAVGLAIGFAIAFSPYAVGGMRMDLRPVGLTVHPPDATHAVPFVAAGDWQANTDYTVNVYLVDTGNPQGAISFRNVCIDSADSTGVHFIPSTFNWVMPFTGMWPNLPNTCWTYPLPMPFPLFQITLPDNGEVRIGDMNVRVDASGALLDLSNHDASDPNFGARVDFGFGGAGDPVTTWRAYTGEITGGMLEFAVPEPTTVALVFAGTVFPQGRRRGGA